MNISDEAVEAAYDAMPVDVYVDNHDQVRAMLEAAAPYMQPGSWHEGYVAGATATRQLLKPEVSVRDAWHDAVSEAYVEGALSADQAAIMWNKNPYRSQA